MDKKFNIKEWKDTFNESMLEAKLNEAQLLKSKVKIKEALALLAGSTNKRDREIIKLLRSALKDLY
jgi:hypothetical protein